MSLAAPEKIWFDSCYYYYDAAGKCMPKYVLVLAVDVASGDSVTAVLTSSPNGLPVHPRCYQGNPRSGYYAGVPGGKLAKETWVDFNSLQTLDDVDLANQAKQGRKTLLSQTLSRESFCGVLRCLLGYDDLERRHARLIRDLAGALGCP